VKRRTKILLATIGLVVVAVASVPFLLNANTFRPTIEMQLTAALGRSVKLGDLRLSLLSGSLVGKDLSIADDSNFSVAPFLIAKELRIGVLLRPLIFSRKVNLESFEIISPQITLIRASNGTWNFSSIGRAAPADARASGAAANTDSRISKRPAPGLPTFLVAHIAIEEGRTEIARMPTHGEPIVYQHLNLTVRDFSFGSQFPFELSADLPAGGAISATGHVGPFNRDDVAASPGDAQVYVKGLDPVAAGFLDPDAGLALLADIDIHAVSDGQTINTRGSVHIQNLKLRKGATAARKPLDFAYSGTYHMKANNGRIEDATAKIDASAIHVNGTYQITALGVQDPLLDLKIAGQRLLIDDLQSMMTAADVHLPNGAVLKGGTLSLGLSITGPVKSLIVAGTIALDNTRLVGFDLGSKIHGVAALGGVKTGDTTDIEKLRVTVRITNAEVAIEKIEAVIPAVGEVIGSGTVGAADELDLNLLAKVAAKGIGKVGAGLLTKLNGSDGASGKVSGVPLRVTGTPEEPNITADVGGIFQKKAKSLAAIVGKKN
jgi:AsmA protein